MILEAAVRLQGEREERREGGEERREGGEKAEDEKTVESVSEEAIFKCLN
jgi:hypothetical protein